MAQEPQNLANAAVIIAASFFLFQNGFNWWLVFLIGWGIATWAHWHVTEDQKELIRLGIEQSKANIENMKAATGISIINAKLIARQIGQ